jgi:hypothetical protein
VIIVFYVVQTQETIISKYLFTVILSFIISMILLHVFVRPFAVTRFLFGMKPKEKSRNEPAKQAAPVDPVPSVV